MSSIHFHFHFKIIFIQFYCCFFSTLQFVFYTYQKNIYCCMIFCMHNTSFILSTDLYNIIFYHVGTIPVNLQYILIFYFSRIIIAFALWQYTEFRGLNCEFGWNQSLLQSGFIEDWSFMVLYTYECWRVDCLEGEIMGEEIIMTAYQNWFSL